LAGCSQLSIICMPIEHADTALIVFVCCHLRHAADVSFSPVLPDAGFQEMIIFRFLSSPRRWLPLPLPPDTIAAAFRH